MALRDILIWPDPVLAKHADPIEAIDDDVIQLARDMVQTMYAARGIGLAANQVGVLKRLIVVDLNPIPGEEEEGEARDPLYGPHVFINPEITQKDGEICWEEGCLSVPGEVGEVTAAEIVCWLPATDIRPDSICVDVGLGGPCHSPTARASSNRGSRAALSACALMS